MAWFPIQWVRDIKNLKKSDNWFKWFSTIGGWQTAYDNIKNGLNFVNQKVNPSVYADNEVNNISYEPGQTAYGMMSADDMMRFQQDSLQQQQAFNAAQVDLSYQRQRELRQTAYQDTMKDLQAAGLNPALMFSQGATSAPSVNSATTSHASGGTDDSIIAAVIAANAQIASKAISSALSLVKAK